MRKHSLRLFIISAAALAVFAVAAIAVSVALTGKAVDDGLISVADFVENACLGGADIDDIVEYADEGAPDMRITFIAKDGAVIADSSPWNSSENHIDRPEVEDALSKGEGFAERRSDTDGGNMNYYARLIELPGYGEVVLRVATPGSATKDVLAAMIPACVVLILAIALSMYLVDRYYNKSVTKNFRSTRAIRTFCLMSTNSTRSPRRSTRSTRCVASFSQMRAMSSTRR